MTADPRYLYGSWASCYLSFLSFTALVLVLFASRAIWNSVLGHTTASWLTYRSTTIAARSTSATMLSVTSGSCLTSLDAAMSATTPAAATTRIPISRSCCECDDCPPSTITPSCCLAFYSRVLPPSYSGCLPSRPPRSCLVCLYLLVSEMKWNENAYRF